MEKQKKWQLFLILAVIGLTVYHILPTLFYYSKPLKSPITERQADNLAASIVRRVDELKSDSKDWIVSFAGLLHVKPQSISSEGQTWVVRFAKSEEAAKFRKFLPRAGALIPFIPAQLGLAPQEESTKEVIVQRQIPDLLNQAHFSFAKKGSPLYRELMIDRAAQIVYALTGPTESALALHSKDPRMLEPLALQILSIAELSEEHKSAANRLAASCTQGLFPNRTAAIEALISAFDEFRDQHKKDPKVDLFIQAENFLKKHTALFASGAAPWSFNEVKQLLEEKETLQIGARNPLFASAAIDWAANQIVLKLHPDVHGPQLEQLLINEAAKITRITNETVAAGEGKYTVALHSLPDTTGFLVLHLADITELQGNEILSILKTQWHPQHPDLQSLHIASSKELLSAEQKALSLLVYTEPSLRIVAKGIDQILANYEQFPHSEPAQTFSTDFRSLNMLLQQNGFQGYRGANNELVFAKRNEILSLLAATREEFTVKGSQKYAALELSTLEQRLLSANRIDTAIHEDLIKWQDEYNAAQVNLDPSRSLDVPKPTKNVFLSNLALSWKKLFRGDEKKVIRWGLDLSGGKSVQIELRDANHRLVTNEADLKQGINELYNRVNKMGVSEVAIRQLGNNIVLDFPGSQSLSASQLIKASSMVFHIVNEKWVSSPSINRFLQEVWNEAVVMNRKDAVSINEIAWKHLHSEAGRPLLESGFILQDPKHPMMSSELDESSSKIALIRGDNWFGQTHPLLVVFSNYALEGSGLDHIQPNYDPQKGNYLSFEVKGSKHRDALYAWTSRYSKEKVLGTPLEDYAKGRGWRMAVVLNDTVISAPTLDAVIRDSASISGNFSQREVSQLASDLKAGSLTFTPHILSEKNVSPELGQKERIQGIAATIVALLLIILSMVVYYRFAGFIASIAVLFNLLILWATLQNIGAALSLAGIAGIILTVGMAVDANVLVFERIKEEFAVSKNIASAISAGYKKAYSAIVDSNLTTIIVALILLNFDAGPIKGFAITLIIGIASSMFTALFMTRFYFTGWAQNPKHTLLNMANWIHSQSIDFLKQAKLAFAITAVIALLGGALIYTQRATIFGMDFTGGFSLHVETEKGGQIGAVEEALLAGGASAQDFQVREMNPSNHLRILFGTSMEQPGKPFFKLPLETEKKTNPRIDWVVHSLEARGLSLTPDSRSHLEANWTAMSGQMSDTMRNNALIGLLVAFICIFIYIAIRFEYKFAAASIVCLLHDVLITMGLLGILHACGVPVQIDLNTVAAIMTIVGYSLNDTIIIFDRIREEMRLSKHKSLPRIVNHALNATLSRTTITSGTTLLVLIALVILGGSSIFSFALVMTIGVFFGTLSSWYIASPLMLFFHGKEEKAIA